MRGTHVDAGGRQQGHRIIPADAGNTGSCVGPSRMGGDHPRGCGEHKRCLRALRFGRGSSPRMRRTLQRDRHLLQMCGIIPADAGNTWTRSAYSNPHGDHPRGCGEHLSLAVVVVACSGSSPRMRGTHFAVRSSGISIRIIPADAGNTRPRRPHTRTGPDHPRGCGEHRLPRLA